MKTPLGCLSATSAAAIFAPTPEVERKVSGRLAQKIAGGFPVERIEAPPPALLFPDEAGLLELADVVGDLGLTHPEVVLELANADSRAPFVHRGAEVRQVAAASPLG